MQRLRSLDLRRILRRGRQRCGLRTCRRTITSLLADFPSVSDDHVNSCLQRRCSSFPRIYRGAIRGCIRFIQGGRRVPPTEWSPIPFSRKIKTQSIVCVVLGDGRCALSCVGARDFAGKADHHLSQTMQHRRYKARPYCRLDASRFSSVGIEELAHRCNFSNCDVCQCLMGRALRGKDCLLL